MTSKCPPGVFCIENYTLLIVLILSLCILYYLFNKFRNIENNSFKKSEAIN